MPVAGRKSKARARDGAVVKVLDAKVRRPEFGFPEPM